MSDVFIQGSQPKASEGFQYEIAVKKSAQKLAFTVFVRIFCLRFQSGIAVGSRTDLIRVSF